MNMGYTNKTKPLFLPDFRFTGAVIFTPNNRINYLLWARGVRAPLRRTPLIGFYTPEGETVGTMENSFMVRADEIATVQMAGYLIGQKTVLCLTAQEFVYSSARDARLCPVSEEGWIDYTDPIPLGQWQEVTEAQTKGARGWTFNPADNKFYMAAYQPPTIPRQSDAVTDPTLTE